MKITFLLPLYLPYPVGGYRIVYAYANHLASVGHDVHIVFPRRSRPDHQVKPGRAVADRLWAAAHRLRRRRLVTWETMHPRIKYHLVPSLRAQHIPKSDIGVATSWRTAQPLADSRRVAEKFYLLQHFETWDGSSTEVEATWRLPLRKIVISKWLLDIAAGLGESATHIPNAIDHDLFQVTNDPRRRAEHVVSLYHKEPFKGVPIAIEALRRFHARHPAVPVTMFGAIKRGPEIPEWVTYWENPSQADLVAKIYNVGTIYLGASLEEGWGLPPAEAMACGCAFVGTDIGGFREFAQHEKNALLVPRNDPDALADAMSRLLADPHERMRLAELGTAEIKAFTWARSGAQFAQALGAANASKRAREVRQLAPQRPPTPSPV